MGLQSNDSWNADGHFRRMSKAAGMLMLLRSMAPDVVAVDEVDERGYHCAGAGAQMRVQRARYGSWRFV